MRAHRKVSITVARQYSMIAQALEDRRWRTTNGIADAVPWSVRTVWDRLCEMEARGLVRSRRQRTDQAVTEVHWRACV